MCDVLIIGGGPAGLRAAELVSAAGLRIILADRMRSTGRKFLVAGRGGLNLTHSEPLETFLPRYGEPQDRWRDLLEKFSSTDLREWARKLGIETFVGTSGRVFPVGKQAAPFLRRWIERLRRQGVEFRLRHRLTGFRRTADDWEVQFESTTTLRARAVILALGGASWPQTGSDGGWIEMLAQSGIEVTPLAPANVGYEIDWPVGFLAAAEGLPLKNIVASAGEKSVAGELLVTKYGLEGGALYQLSRELRLMAKPEIVIDLKPAFSVSQLAEKLGQAAPNLEKAAKVWRLSAVAQELLRLREPFASTRQLADTAKHYRLALRNPRPIAEAISTAGGVAWEALTENLMLKNCPGIFCAGEMIDWEAPTGGYLLQGCLATGTRAARGAQEFLG